MSINVIWQVPSKADGRYGAGQARLRGERSAWSDGVTDPRTKQFNYFDYLHQVARAAELAGFDGLQIQHDPTGDESWIIAGYLARSTRKLTLIAEFEASWGSAVYAAKNAASLQRYTNGRFAWQLSRQADSHTRKRNADFVLDEQQLPRIEEFLHVAQGVLTTSPFTHKGQFFEVFEGGFKGPLAKQVVPPVYLSGHDDASLQLSARKGDVHLLPALAPEQLTPIIERLQQLASEAGRTVKLGLRIDLLARETTAEALHDAQRYWQQTGHSPIAKQSPLQEGLWPNFATKDTDASAALIGSYEQVIERLSAYAQLGVSEFVLAAIPHFEEAYRIGAHVLPQLREQLEPVSVAA